MHVFLPFCSSSFSPLWAEGGWQFVTLINKSGSNLESFMSFFFFFSVLVTVPTANNQQYYICNTKIMHCIFLMSTYIMLIFTFIHHTYYKTIIQTYYETTCSSVLINSFLHFFFLVWHKQGCIDSILLLLLLFVRHTHC